MPELPEVETFARQLKPLVINRPIQELKIISGGERLIGKQDLKLLQTHLYNDSIQDITRHGKYIIFQLTSGNRIVAHLRMTGRFIFSKEPLINKFNRLYIHFIDGSYLNFIDIRKFATFDFQLAQEFQNKYKIKALGPDATDDTFNNQYLTKHSARRKRNIYATLLDQTIVAGIGNIYANEALFASKIHPLRPTDSLDAKEIDKLIKASKNILVNAIEHRGTTLIDNSYTDIDGNSGEFSKSLKVYARYNQPCRVCGTLVCKMKIAQRSVFYCPKCQKL
jgi:formamidopyrimidine-DNA glycosylase